MTDCMKSLLDFLRAKEVCKHKTGVGWECSVLIVQCALVQCSTRLMKFTGKRVMLAGGHGVAGYTLNPHL